MVDYSGFTKYMNIIKTTLLEKTEQCENLQRNIDEDKFDL